MRLGVRERLMPCELENAEIILSEMPTVHTVGPGSPEALSDDGTAGSVDHFKSFATEGFCSAMEQASCALNSIHRDFEENLWTADDIDYLGDLLCKRAHRFSKHNTDLGHVTVDPFAFYIGT